MARLNFSRGSDGQYRSAEERLRAKVRFGIGGVAVLVALLAIVMVAADAAPVSALPDAFELLADGIEAINSALGA
jgi:hypothetical protein